MARILIIGLLAAQLACVARTDTATSQSIGDALGDSSAGDASSGDSSAGDASFGDSSAGDRFSGDSSAGDDSPASLETLNCDLTPAAPACDDLEVLFHLDSTDGLADVSGNGNHGVCDGASCPTFDAGAGRFGGGFVFDGDDYFEIPDHPSLDISGAATVSAWFRPSALAAGDYTVVVAKIDTSPLESNYWLGHQAEQFVVTFIDDASGGWNNHGDGRIWPLDTWYHLVGIIDNDNDRIQLYVNGELVFDDSESDLMGLEDGNLYIGRGPGDQGANGVIDEVAIWRRALTENEIAALYR